MAAELDDLDALGAKLVELSGRVRSMRDENQQLRTQLAAAQTELDRLRTRVNEATARIDAVLAHLPADERPQP